MRRLLPLALFALLGLTLLPGLGAVDALDVREARDEQVARESAYRRSVFGPAYAGDVLFEKPLPGYAPALVAHVLRRQVPAALAGPHGIATSRALRAALAAALALLVALAGARAFGARAGWLAGCALASTVGLPLATRMDGAQLLATTFAWLGVTLLLEVLRGRARRPDLVRWLAWGSFGGALLTGGPLPALWPLAGFALYFALARSHAGWRDVRPLPGLLVAIGVALPWYGFVFALHGTAFLARVPWFPYAAEARTGGIAAPLGALTYPMLLGFPWTPLLAVALHDAAQRLRGRGARGPADLREHEHVASLVLCLLLAASAPLALYPGAPLTAALPALPAVALLCGRFVDRVLDGDADPRRFALAARFMAGLGTLLAVFATTLAASLGDAAPALRAFGAALLVTSWAAALADFVGRRRLAVALFALPVAVGAPLVAARVLPALEPWLDTRAVVEAVPLVAPRGSKLVLLEPPPPSLRRLRADFVVVPALGSTLADLAARDGNAYLAFPPAREHEVARTAPAPLEILLREPTLVLARIAVAPPATGVAGAPAPER